MSDPISPFSFAPQELQLTHPHTHALAQLQSHPQESALSFFGRRHRRTSSDHSHVAPATNPSSSAASPSNASMSPSRSGSNLLSSSLTDSTVATAAAATSAPSSHSRSGSGSGSTTSSPMPKLFKVEIANNGDCKSSNPIFYPSDLIHGMVYLYLDKPMKLPALKIVFRGESNYPSSRQQDHLDHHMRRLFSVAMTLWGSREALPEDQWGILPAGNHIFPFTVQLPDKNLPASFDHPWLKNQYTLTAYYRRPNGLSKWQSKAKPINFMPLSTPGQEHGPIQESCPKMGTALLLSHPDLTPGGRVHIKLTAAAAIDRCQFSLSRHIRARINETTYKEDEVICHYERKSISKGEFNLVLPIPKITPPTTESSSALKITYSVQVSIWNERFFFKTESHNFDIPIVIRTLPACDNRACEGLDWCEPSVDRPMFLTEAPMQPLPLYDAEQSPPKYTVPVPVPASAPEPMPTPVATVDLPAYDQVVASCSSSMGSLTIHAVHDQQAQEQQHQHQQQSVAQLQQEQQVQQTQQQQTLQPQEQHPSLHHILWEGAENDNDHDDRASTHSVETTNSDVEGHARVVADHPRPHHPSCVYYVAPLDRAHSPTAIRQVSAVSLESASSIRSSGSSSNSSMDANGNDHHIHDNSRLVVEGDSSSLASSASFSSLALPVSQSGTSLSSSSSSSSADTEESSRLQMPSTLSSSSCAPAAASSSSSSSSSHVRAVEYVKVQTTFESL